MSRRATNAGWLHDGDTLESPCGSVSLLEGQMTLAVLDSSHELSQVLLASSND